MLRTNKQRTGEDKYLMFQSTNERQNEKKKKKNKGNCLSRELYAITNYVFSKEWLPEKLMTLGYVLMIHEEKIVAAKSYDKDREK